MSTTPSHAPYRRRTGVRRLGIAAAGLLALAVLMGAAAPARASGPSYSFIPLIYPPAIDGVVPLGINSQCDVVGFFVDTEGFHGFLYRGGIFTPIDAPGATPKLGGTSATGINDSGDISGSYVDSQGFSHGFLLHAGVFTPVDRPGSLDTYPAGINGAGDLVGFETEAGGQFGFVLHNGVYTTVSEPGAIATQALGINDYGDVVGQFQSLGESAGFLKIGSAYTALEPPLADLTDFGAVAEGINDYRQVVGSYTDSNVVGHGFVYANGSYQTLDYPAPQPFTTTQLTGINNAGVIVGTYTLEDFSSGGGFIAVPLPSIPNLTSRFIVSSTPATRAGDAFTFTVTAADGDGNPVPSYRGVVHFASSDGLAVLPSDRPLTNGTGTFTAVLKTAGSQVIVANDRGQQIIAGVSDSIVVSPRGTSHFVVSAPATVGAGHALPFTVTAEDVYGNVVPGYRGVVHMSTTDPEGTVPSDRPLTNGVGAFTAVLRQAGSQTITASDRQLPVITGQSAPIAVTPGSTAFFILEGPTGLTGAIRGRPFSITISTFDTYGNPVTDYQGVTHFSSTDPAAILPADTRWSNGRATFSATLNTVGDQTISANDVRLPVIAAMTGTIHVAADGPPPAPL